MFFAERRARGFDDPKDENDREKSGDDDTLVTLRTILKTTFMTDKSHAPPAESLFSLVYCFVGRAW